MRVATWNVWWRFGPWEERQPAIEHVVSSLDVDAVALQETWPEQAARLAELRGWNHVFSGRRPDEVTEHGFGNAILTPHPILESAEIVLPSPAGPAYRSALHARIDAAHQTDLFSTHLNFRLDESVARQAQLQAVCDFVAECRGSKDGHPPVLLGDLNAVPDSDEIRRLTGRSAPYRRGMVWNDVWDLVGDGPGHTWDRNNPYVEAALWPNRRIDTILVLWPRTGPLGNPVSAELFGSELIDGVLPSDHWGVLADLHDG